MDDALPEVQVRPADPEDAAAIAEVHVASWRAAYAETLPAEYLDALDPADRAEEWRARVAAGRTTLVAEDGGRVVGFASFGPSRDEDAAPGTWEVYAIYLLPHAWGRGAARALMRQLVGQVGDRPTTLWVLGSNERARHFYRRHGFSPDGVERTEEIAGVPVLEVRYRRG